MDATTYASSFSDKVIGMLEKGTAPWQKPWNKPKHALGLPINPTSGNEYHGSNFIRLLLEGREDPRWMTYKQAQNAGCQVRRGEKGTQIAYWDSALKHDNEENPEEITGKYLFCKVYTVFNAEQVEGLEPLCREPEPVGWNPVEQGEQILENSGATIHYREQVRAFYSLTDDKIVLPLRSQFKSGVDFYGTALHELGHWTGHPERLNRKLAGRFGTEAYAVEELRAEIASWMLAVDTGIPHAPEHHAAYVESWIGILKKDPKEILRACADAEKIRTYLMALSAVKKAA